MIKLENLSKKALLKDDESNQNYRLFLKNIENDIIVKNGDDNIENTKYEKTKIESPGYRIR